MKYVRVVLLLFISCENSCENENKTIVFSLGDLGDAKCLVQKSALTQREFYSFLDLRYAEAPIRSRRFKPAEIIKRFTPEFYDASAYKQACLGSSTIFEDDFPDENLLDCLLLTIHTPDINGNYSVMLYLTGFDLYTGSNQEVRPYLLMEHNIVLVSVQYRLGVFGFLNTGRTSIPGNAGISDILTSLKWVQKHITLFGGNPKSVTLFGHYKVAGVIHLLTMIPEADGLFHQIICQSGSALTENLLSYNTQSIAVHIGISLGCPNIMSSKKLSSCLLKANLRDLKNIFEAYVKARNGNIGLLSVAGIDELIPYMPYELKKRRRIRKYPAIMGIVENPSTYLLDEYFPGDLSIFTMNRTNLINGFGIDVEQYKQFLLDTVSNQDKKMRKNFLTGVSLNGHDNRYVYIFRYQNGQHFLKRKPGNSLGDVALLDDNMYLFPRAESMSKVDERIARRLTDLWVSFATNGELKMKDNKFWPPYKQETSRFLIIDEHYEIGNDFQNYLMPFIA